MPLSLRHGAGRERVRLYLKSTDTADHRVSESYALRASDADDGAYPATRGAPPGTYAVAGGSGGERVDAVFGLALGVPVVEGAVLVSTRETVPDPAAPGGARPKAYEVTSVEDARRLRTRFARAVHASQAVYDGIPGGA